VMLDFGTPKAKLLDRLTVKDARRYLEDGQFGTGSMAPKVEAAARFVEATGKRAVITSTDNIESAVAGISGTHFTS
jgi:carbamate kinase